MATTIAFMCLQAVYNSTCEMLATYDPEDKQEPELTIGQVETDLREALEQYRDRLDLDNGHEHLLYITCRDLHVQLQDNVRATQERRSMGL